MNSFFIKEKWLALGIIIGTSIPYIHAENRKDLPQKNWSNDSQWLYDAMASDFAKHAGNYQAAIKNISNVAEQSQQYSAYEYSYNLAIDALALEKAQKIAQSWVATFPDRDEANFALIRVYLIQEKDDSAVVVMKKLLQQKNDLNTAARISRLMTYISDSDKRIHLLDLLSKAFPENPYLAYYLGIAAKESGEVDIAITAFNKALSINGKWKELALMQAEVFSSIGDYKKAKKILDKLRSKDKKNSKIIAAEVDIMINHYQWQSALELIKQWLVLDPNNENILQLQAWVAGNSGDYYLAKEQYERLYDLGILDDNQFSYQLAQSALNAKQYDIATASFNTINKNSNLYMLARQQVALIAFSQNNIAQAQKDFMQLRSQFPEYALEMYVVEIANLDKHSAFKAASKILDEALTKYPEQIDLLFSKAEHLTATNQIDDAIAQYQKIIAIDSSNIDAINAYGYLLLTRASSQEKAEKLIKQALKEFDESPAIQDSYAWLLYLKGQYKPALKWIQRAYSAFRQDEVVGHYVQILKANDLDDLAQQVFWTETIGQPDNATLKAIGIKLGLKMEHDEN